MAHRMLAESERALVRQRCESVLRQNWREGTRPEDGQRIRVQLSQRGAVPVAVVLGLLLSRHRLAPLRPDRARRELESLLAAQRPDGFIGHTIFWHEPLRGIRRYTYNVISPSRSDDLEHPAADAGVGVADRGGRPGR